MKIHLGELITKKMEEREISKSELARKIKTSRQNLRDILSRESMDTDLVFNFSKVLDFNFFEVLASKVKIKSKQ